jgi:hypothetical protein
MARKSGEWQGTHFFFDRTSSADEYYQQLLSVIDISTGMKVAQNPQHCPIF